MSDMIGGRCFVESGMMKEVKNLRRRSSSPSQDGERVPISSASASIDGVLVQDRVPLDVFFVGIGKEVLEIIRKCGGCFVV